MATSSVCPPDTSSRTSGGSSSGSSRNAAYRWASRWLTPTNGTPQASANAFAALTPTNRAPTSPGPIVAATAATSGPSQPASSSASATTGLSSCTWARLATSGTTPPKQAWRSTWLDTTDEARQVPSTTTAAAVSSHDVSIPRMAACVSVTALTALPARGRSRLRCSLPVLDDRGTGHVRLEPGETLGVLGRVDVLGPHHQGVLVRLLVVVLADAGG